MGATALIALSGKLEDTNFGEAADVDVVLDYLWSDVAKVVVHGIIARRRNKSQRPTWVEIGALAGHDVQILGCDAKEGECGAPWLWSR